jgi:LDH2 family malate/lactate/ureidoglycolate dehydrogenase
MAIAEPQQTFAPAEGSTLEPYLKGKVRVNADALTQYVAALFRHNNMPEKDALISAKGIVLADLVGHESHGVSNNLAGFYLPDLESGVVNARPNIRIVRESPSTATWEADGAMGFVIASAAMEDAMERADKVGSGWAAVGNSRHYGMAQIYSRMALARDMIGFSMTNGVTPGVVPFGGLDPKLGTNPISIAVPTGEEHPFVLDMATSTSAFGKIDNYQREGKTIPPTWALGRDGLPTTDPAEAKAAVKLLTFGGTKEGAAHKGYGLAVWVDIMCGALSGWGFIGKPGEEENVNHFFGAWKVDNFVPIERHKALMDERIRDLRSSAVQPGFKRVMVAGQPEFENLQDRTANGVPLHPTVITMLKGYGEKYGIPYDLTD